MLEGMVAQYGKDVIFLAIFVAVLVEVSRMIPFVGKKIQGKVTRWVSAAIGLGLAFLNNLTAGVGNKEGIIVVIGTGILAAWFASGGTDWLRKVFAWGSKPY